MVKYISMVFNKLFPRDKGPEKVQPPQSNFNVKVSQSDSSIPRYTHGEEYFLDHKIRFVDIASFNFIKEEIFTREVYRFDSINPKPYIIDAGANIGLSAIYFKKLFPNAEIVAFEPDKSVYDVLTYNVRSFGFDDVKLVQKALWKEETTLQFFGEGADGGRVAIPGDRDNIIGVPAIRLRNYLDKEVDFLKMDIEGAEAVVLDDCKDLLVNVKNIFVEYHSFKDRPQEIHQLLNILISAGFRVYIASVNNTSKNPFIQDYSYLGMDNQLNIYAINSSKK